MKFEATLSLAASATSTLQTDGSISVSIVLTKPGTDGAVQFSQAGHYISPGEAAPLVDAPPTAAELAAGLSLRDIVTARGLRHLCEKWGQPLQDLLPAGLRDA